MSRQSAALSSAIQLAMAPELDGRLRTGINTRFPLPTLLFAGYSVKLVYFYSMGSTSRHEIYFNTHKLQNIAT